MKIAILSSHTSSLFWFRMDMMKHFKENGHIVIALGSEPESKWKMKFGEHDIEYKQIYVERNGMNPFKDLKTLNALDKFMRKERPDKVFAYQAKTVIYGSIAAKMNKITEFYPLIAGLGSIFRGQDFKSKIVKSIMKIEYRIACKYSKRVMFQNQDDKNEFIQNGLLKNSKTALINGSGVNLDMFKPVPLPQIPTFLFIGRLIKDKGLMEYLEACKVLKTKNPEVRCMLVGPYDSNPSAIKPDDLAPYINSGIVEYFGEQDDVRPYISQCSVYVLPSYHEGTPKTVLEAMAMGRAIITSDAPGCRETVTDSVNGYLVPVHDVQGLINKMEYMASNPEVCKSMGIESLQIAESKYDVKIVNKSIMEIMGL
ncbi:glycosyltransferase [Sporosarcina sp. P16a]|uniref:glycosyltransferase family 4 protein n=1 Tax=unclassified Sporosarcina TaxID=2647733 RepID=UPI000C16B9AD|nr:MULTISPECIES: glycosyltransferase family 4 protein [unclassified Sporosarcina]PIC67979.1 glycosyltransferase [Sporosarcina sp. P16a]PIC94288.1 glycosyltransferase [Sporosarcina sp. P25]